MKKFMKKLAFGLYMVFALSITVAIIGSVILGCLLLLDFIYEKTPDNLATLATCSAGTLLFILGICASSFLPSTDKPVAVQ